MCHNHQILYLPCHHIHKRITLCQYAITPLVRRATTFPFILPLQIPPQDPLFGDSKHDVTTSGEMSHELCEDCRLPDLDVFHLEDMEKELGYRIAVDVERGQREMATAPVMTRREVVNVQAVKEAPVKELKGVGKGKDLQVEVVKLQDQKEQFQRTDGTGDADKAVATTSWTALPYTGGLGLLVSVKNAKRIIVPEAELGRRKRQSKL